MTMYTHTSTQEIKEEIDYFRVRWKSWIEFTSEEDTDQGCPSEVYGEGKCPREGKCVGRRTVPETRVSKCVSK